MATNKAACATAIVSRAVILILLLVAVASTAALISGTPLLEAPLPGGLPAGNLLAAVALCSLGATAVGLSRSGTLLRRISIAALVAAIAWLPVSIALAGNLALNFDGARGQAWAWLSLATIVLVVSAVATAGIGRLARR